MYDAWSYRKGIPSWPPKCLDDELKAKELAKRKPLDHKESTCAADTEVPPWGDGLVHWRLAYDECG